MIEQLPLLSHDLPPLALRDRVRTPEGWVGEVAQVWPDRDWYVVFSWDWHGPIAAPLPSFRRDELELVVEGWHMQKPRPTITPRPTLEIAPATHDALPPHWLEWRAA